MAERSPGPAEPAGEQPAPPDRLFPRARLIIGVVLVLAVVLPLAIAIVALRRPPDPGRLLYLSGESVVVRELESGEERTVAEGLGRIRDTVLSPDGGRLAYSGRPGQAFILDLGDGSIAEVAGRGDPTGWTPAGHLVVVASRPRGWRTLAVVENQDTLDRSRILPGGPETPVGRPLWTERDTLVVGVSEGRGPQELWVVSIAGDEPRVIHRIEGARPLEASADGRQILYADGESGDMALNLLSLRDRTTEEIARAESFDGAVLGPRGLVVVWGHDDGAPALWLFTPASERIDLLLGGEKGPPIRNLSAAAWSAEGSRILFLDGERVRAVRIDGSDLRTVVERARPGFLEVLDQR